VKRLIDVVGAVVLLVAAAPVLGLAAVAVMATSRGPVLLIQQRVGQGGETFGLVKLRSMRVDAGDDAAHRALVARELTLAPAATGEVFKVRHDPRITPVGRVLRRSSIDELPQLLNVLAGHMSLVGPRPSLPWEHDLYPEPARSERVAVRPGITGLWQVSGRNRLPVPAMLELDRRYIRTWTVAGDLAILARTPLVALRGDGAG
jgi:lipopolysaccharide/colanic/teichoic acid biosynthesis glycosyltransferase